jgi:hypothetical protein
MANWVSLRHQIGDQPIEDTVLSTAQHPTGSITRARNITSASVEGEFIYLLGVASTTAGSLVVYNSATGTVLAQTVQKGPVAVAMSANVANQYGWYQVGGLAVVVANSASAGAPVYATSTAGSVDAAAISAQKVDGAIFAGAMGTPVAGTAYVMLDRPAMNGNTN